MPASDALLLDSTQLSEDEVLHPLQNFIFRQLRGVEQQGVAGGHQRRRGPGTIAAIALAQFRHDGVRRRPANILLLQSPLFAHPRVGVEKDFYVSLGKDLGADVSALHDHAAAGAHFLLPGDHPLPHSGMDRHPRGGLGDVGFAHSLAHVAAVEEHPVAAHAGFKQNARVVRQLDQRGLVVERYIPLDRLQGQGAVHGAALQVHVAQLAGQARGDGALAGAGGAVNGDDEFACRG